MRNWLQKVMTGRYGVDHFNRFLNATALISLVLSVLFRGFVSTFFWFVAILTLVFSYIRMFSRKTAKRRAENSGRMTWLIFNAELHSKKNDEDKYRYAYSTFVDQLQKMPTFVKKSDTPRKIRDRLAASGRVATKHEIEIITEAFEQIEYADKPATPETEKAMNALCDKIRENL